MEIRFKKLNKNAVEPFIATEGDAGADLTAVKFSIKDDIVTYYTGLSVEIPKGHFGLLTNRSSISKKDLDINTGIIDSGFRGEIRVVFRRFGENIYDIGERVAQLVIIPYINAKFVEGKFNQEVTERGSNGFGHSGK